MSRQRQTTAILFSAILAFGVTLSAIHLHPVDYHDNQTLHQVTEIDHLCLMCGSVIKHTPVVQFEIIDQSVPVISFFVQKTEFVSESYHLYRSDRAPPFSLSV